MGLFVVSGCSDTNAPAEVVTTYALAYYDDELDLDNGVVNDCSGGINFCVATSDLHLAYNGTRATPAVVFQNRQSGRQIAHLRGRSFASVSLADTAGASFTSQLIDEAFDDTRTILVRTDAGNVYKLGNPVGFGPQQADSVRFDTARLN